MLAPCSVQEGTTEGPHVSRRFGVPIPGPRAMHVLFLYWAAGVLTSKDSNIAIGCSTPFQGALSSRERMRGFMIHSAQMGFHSPICGRCVVLSAFEAQRLNRNAGLVIAAI